MRIKYDEIKKDYNYLASICPVGDMMEVDAQVFELMENPTKSKASKMYRHAMEQWFNDIQKNAPFSEIPDDVKEDSEVLRIAEKYGYEHYLD